MRAAGPLAGLRYIFTGELDDAALARVARAALAPAPEEPAALLPAAATAPPMSDADWRALQAGCG
jgi:hypothetical protein